MHVLDVANLGLAVWRRVIFFRPHRTFRAILVLSREHLPAAAARVSEAAKAGHTFLPR